MELIGRHSGTSDYRLKVLYRADGTVQALISKVVSGTDTTLKSLVIPNLTYTPGTPLRIRFVVSGTGTTSLSGTVWPVGTSRRHRRSRSRTRPRRFSRQAASASSPT